MENQVEEFVELEKKSESLKTRIIRIDEQLKAKKQALTELVKEIKDAGYDPANLKQIIQQEETDIKDKIVKFKQELETVSSELAKIEE